MLFLGGDDVRERRQIAVGLDDMPIVGAGRVFVVHGDADRLVQQREGRRRLQGAAAQDRLVIVGHDRPPRTCLR
ncbi:hypothetical protein SDC9_191397 [bioreactor metagenome]|uniref:Uncharacterized protein n=1 Tax=bioreactor metagenome TaxID=1076179 RepID=A0A645HZ22_9ZZZZ